MRGFFPVPAEVERHFHEALALGRQDTYLLTSYADFLLDEERPEKVLQLLGNAAHNDAFLLRMALAGSPLRRPSPGQ